MKKWEYIELTVCSEKNYDNYELKGVNTGYYFVGRPKKLDGINMLDNEGWELVSCYNTSINHEVFYLKRELSNE